MSLRKLVVLGNNDSEDTVTQHIKESASEIPKQKNHDIPSSKNLPIFTLYYHSLVCMTASPVIPYLLICLLAACSSSRAIIGSRIPAKILDKRTLSMKYNSTQLADSLLAISASRGNTSYVHQQKRTTQFYQMIMTLIMRINFYFIDPITAFAPHQCTYLPSWPFYVHVIMSRLLFVHCFAFYLSVFFTFLSDFKNYHKHFISNSI